MKGINMKKFYSVICLSFLIILLFVTPVIGSSDWEKYYTGESGDVSLYNIINIEKDNKVHLAQVWSKDIYSDKIKEFFKKIYGSVGMSTEGLSHTLILHEIDCKKKTSRIFYHFLYDTDGKKIDTVFFENEPKWNATKKDTPADSLQKKVCLSDAVSSGLVFLGTNHDNGSVLFYYKDRIKHRTKNIVQVWEKIVLSDEHIDKEIQLRKKNGLSIEGWDKLEFDNFLFEINCKENKYRIIYNDYYDRKGRQLESFDDDKSQWTIIPPNTNIDNLQKKVCK
jgi:hypothetical protein